MKITKRLGQNIQKLRVNGGLTQDQVSDSATIDRSFVQRIEAGTSSSTAEVLIRLKRALKCSWDELFQGIE